jgi:hypothetical protein
MYALINLSPMNNEYKSGQNLTKFSGDFATVHKGVELLATTVFLINLDTASEAFAALIKEAAKADVACEMRLLPEVPAWLPLIPVEPVKK